MLNHDAKIQSQTRTPGSEAALRRMIAGIRAGEPNYDEMTPWFADLVRHTIHLYQSTYAARGAFNLSSSATSTTWVATCTKSIRSTAPRCGA